MLEHDGPGSEQGGTCEALTGQSIYQCRGEETIMNVRSILRKRSLPGFLALVAALLLFLSPLTIPKAYASYVNRETPSAQGKEIVVNLSQQRLYAFQDGTQVYSAAVMTGRPALPTPTGTYHVFAKLSPTTFYSPWPPSSPYWYAPTHINYALEWGVGGYFLHDSWWHSVYGPGTNDWHYDPVDGWQWGTHGCVAMPLNVAAWLYGWAPIGTTVQINP
jgi:L,D-transpeptidase catalytic domain